jgi:hypothetical protein
MVAPGGAAHFLIAKYRCDVKSVAAATAVVIVVVPPKNVVRVSLPLGYAGPTIDYCGPASSDPGNTVQVGPYSPGTADGI